ncbi:MAG: hypothetical protein ABI576_16855 [Flavobacterium sp.]
MKINSIIKGVPSSYKINDCTNYIYINSDDILKIYNNQGIIVKVDELNKPKATIISNCNTWIGNPILYRSTILNETLEPIKEVDYLASTWKAVDDFSTKNYIYATVYKKDSLKKIGKISKKDFDIEELYDFEIGFGSIYLVISDVFFISISINKIGLFNFENEAIWQHSYSDLLDEEDTKISTEIVEVSGVVYFLLHGGGKHECFGLNANTGEIVKRISNIVGDIIVENEFIYFLHSEIITIYNTQNDKIITWEIENLMIEKGIERLWFPRWAIDNGLIYFSQSKGADRNSDNVGARFGVLDPTKKELLWHDKLPLENGIIGSIKVNQNRIYLHTQDQTLFVYEKE